MKIDSIEHRKKRILRANKKKYSKINKKCYNYDKKDHFAWDCRSKNKKNWQQINVLIRASDKTEVQKKESDTDIWKLTKEKNLYENQNLRQNIQFFLYLRKMKNFVYMSIIESWTRL